MIYFLVLLLTLSFTWWTTSSNATGDASIIVSKEVTRFSWLRRILVWIKSWIDFFRPMIAVGSGCGDSIRPPNLSTPSCSGCSPGGPVEFATYEVVDEVFLNLPSEEYDIGEYVSQFETMGIDVTVNLNAFWFELCWQQTDSRSGWTQCCYLLDQLTNLATWPRNAWLISVVPW